MSPWCWCQCGVTAQPCGDAGDRHSPQDQTDWGGTGQCLYIPSPEQSQDQTWDRFVPPPPAPPSASGAAQCFYLPCLHSLVSDVGGAVSEPEMGPLKESPVALFPNCSALTFPSTRSPPTPHSPPYLQQCPADPSRCHSQGTNSFPRWSWGWPGTLGMGVGTFNHHILMLLSTQLGQAQSASWFGASSHFPDDSTALCQPLVLSRTGRRVIKNGPLWWGSCTEPFPPGLQ